MYAHVFLEVMLELKGLITLIAFEFTQQGGLIMADHVTLQAIDIGKSFVADFAALKGDTRKK